MLRNIKGKIVSVETEYVLIESGNLTLEAVASYRILKDVALNTEHNFEARFEMNEWNFSLFLFKDKIESEMYEKLKSVSKIGPKSSAKIVRACDAEMVSSLIVSEDINGLSKIPGVGKKTAERIISELKGSVAFFGINKNDTKVTDALDALEVLGFDRNKAIKTIKEIDISNMTVEEIIKNSLIKLK